ncbi:MAG: lasso peptide biosynthesis B2 protein [Gemmatimonadetes bacterium]|nr:MAG: lasso peptide biosynthesis B2 protein [Gemmatimonadota bacterium]
MTRAAAAVRAVRDGRWIDIRDVGEAQLALLRAQTLRWLRPVGEFVEVAATDSNADHSTGPAQRRTCERVASAIDRAARYGIFRPLCLTRAMALSQMLERHGIRGQRIRVGVRRDGESFAAHAWVELDQLVLGDTSANTLSYLPLTSISRKRSHASRALQSDPKHQRSN